MSNSSKSFNCLASIDPSFTSSGLAIIDLVNKKIYTHAIKIGCKDKTFDGIQKSISDIIIEIKKDFDKFNVDALIHEQPFPGRMFSPALYGLDSVINQTFKSIIIKTYHPSVLRKIHGFKYTKSDSIKLAKSYLKDMIENKEYIYINELPENKLNKKDLFGNNLSRNNEYKLTSDESEALIYSYNLLYCSE